MTTPQSVSKADLYREALRKLGPEVKFAEFRDYCKQHYHLDKVVESRFHELRKEYRSRLQSGEPEGAVGAVGAVGNVGTMRGPVPTLATATPLAPTLFSPPVEKPRASSPGQGPISIPLADLQEVIRSGRSLKKRFGGDVQSLVRFLEAL